MPLLNLKELSLYYEERGSGFPLVLLPGLGMPPEQMAPYFTALSRRRRVILVDMRGGRNSDCPPAPYTTLQMADDVAQVLGVLGVERTDIFAISMGGFVAQELSVAYPWLVRRQILALSALSIGARGRERLKVGMQLRENPGLLELHYRERFLWLFDESIYQSEGVIDEVVANALEASKGERLEGIRGQTAACCSHDCSERAGQIVAPTLVLGGKRDLVCDHSRVRALADAIPQAELAWFDCAHVPMFPVINDILSAVVAYLDRP